MPQVSCGIFSLFALHLGESDPAGEPGKGGDMWQIQFFNPVAQKWQDIKQPPEVFDLTSKKLKWLAKGFDFDYRAVLVKEHGDQIPEVHYMHVLQVGQ